MSTPAVVPMVPAPQHVAPDYVAPPTPAPKERYPEIEAVFSPEKYLLREAMLAAVRHGIATLPYGFPQSIDAPSVWSPVAFPQEQITYRASVADIEELQTALEAFSASGMALNELSPATFRLPTFGSKLREMSWQIHTGEGAVIIKGLQPDQYSLKDNIVIFAGLASYIGDQRGRQSAQNDVLTHLYSSQDKSITDPRPGLSNHGLPFHNDHCDILALYVMETARAGGATRWSSFGQIYNEMARTKPQVIEVLARNDWPHETPTGAAKYLPLMFLDENRQRPFLSFTRFALTGLPTYPRGPNAPKLSPEQADALDTIQFLAAKHAVEVRQEKGDIFMINNRDVLHARDEIQDTPGESRRHLLRLCLRDTEYGQGIPDDLKRRWGDIFDNNQHKDGKWMLIKENTAAFISNKQFDSAFPNDETTGSHG